MKSNSAPFRAPLTCLFLALLAVSGATMAGGDSTMSIDVDTDEIRIEQLDISHLSPGDAETLYTDDGRTIDILRQERGIEIFVDGEPLLSPALLHADPDSFRNHGAHQVMIRIECETEDDDQCAEVDDSQEGGWAIDAAHGTNHVIVIRTSGEGDEEI